MKLYGSYTSPYVRHCRIALIQSGLNWEFVDTDYESSAQLSPTKKVPFLHDGENHFTDSNSILMHICDRLGVPFMNNAQEMELYATINTAMDSAINLFLLGKEGVNETSSPYLARQRSRVESVLNLLEESVHSYSEPLNHAQIRLACFLEWGLFRNQIALENHTNLKQYLDDCRAWQTFADTTPPS